MAEDISFNDFMAYENIRLSGVTNMWAVDFVSKLSGLDEETILKIMKNYGQLAKKYLKGGEKDEKL